MNIFSVSKQSVRKLTGDNAIVALSKPTLLTVAEIEAVSGGTGGIKVSPAYSPFKF